MQSHNVGRPTRPPRCYKFPWIPVPTPAPAACCTLPLNFGPNVVPVTYVHWTLALNTDNTVFQKRLYPKRTLMPKLTTLLHLCIQVRSRHQAAPRRVLLGCLRRRLPCQRWLLQLLLRQRPARCPHAGVHAPGPGPRAPPARPRLLHWPAWRYALIATLKRFGCWFLCGLPLVTKSPPVSIVSNHQCL